MAGYPSPTVVGNSSKPIQETHWFEPAEWAASWLHYTHASPVQTGAHSHGFSMPWVGGGQCMPIPEGTHILLVKPHTKEKQAPKCTSHGCEAVMTCIDANHAQLSLKYQHFYSAHQAAQIVSMYRQSPGPSEVAVASNIKISRGVPSQQCYSTVAFQSLSSPASSDIPNHPCSSLGLGPSNRGIAMAHGCISRNPKLPLDR